MKRRLVSHAYPSYLLVVAITAAAVTWYASSAISDFHHARTMRELTAAALLGAENVKASGALADPRASVAVDTACKALGKASGYRFTFILPSGAVIGDSEESPGAMAGHARRQEVADAFSGGTGVATRYSETMREHMMYVAVRVRTDNGEDIGVMRASLSLSAVDKALRSVWVRIAFSSLLVACMAALISVLMSRKISRPLEQLREEAAAVSRGEMPAVFSPSGIVEIDALARTMTGMADDLNAKIRTITQQHDEQNALLSCMIENVIAVDTEKRLIRLNKAAAEFFGADSSLCGRNIMEVIRNADLLEIVDKALESSEPVESGIFIPDGERHLQAHGTRLRGADGRSMGAVIVLNDITRLKKLEVIRRDFVANVSHELKTPVTSIQGFMEMLLDGSARDPAETDKFMRIVARQANRLNAIIEDLLTLSRMEQEDGRRSVTLEPGPLRPVLENAIEICLHKTREKDMKVELRCDPGLMARINAPLLEQAVVNLVDNAVKYGAKGDTVEVEAGEETGWVALRVRDHGCGIEARHLARIFERFYRVDKARSRSLGGTGLGLAIVKHIAATHGGKVAAESEPGKGSTFSILLPGT